MKSSKVIEFCSGIETKLDTCLFRSREEEDKDLKGAAITAGAGAAGLGAAGVLGHRHVMKNYGGEGGVKEAYKNVGRNVAEEAKDAVKRGRAGWYRGRGLGGKGPVLAGLKGSLASILKRAV